MRTREELARELITQLNFVKLSADGYDAGMRGEAKRMATAAFIILMDRGQNKSLLTQLGELGQLRFLSSGRPVNKRNLLDDMPLVSMRITSGSDGAVGEYVPNLDGWPEHHRLVQFHTWRDEPIYRARGQRTLSRKALIYSLRDQDGGAHFDDRLKDLDYTAAAIQDAFHPQVIQQNRPARQMEHGPQLAMMRQVAHEILHSTAELRGRLVAGESLT